MTYPLRRRTMVAALILCLGAGPAVAAPRRTAAGPVVLAASSLQGALTAAANAYAATGKPKPVLSFAASSQLARQIENGAPADLFISADETWMDHLAEKHLIILGSRTSFLGNRLALIAPIGRPFKIAIRPGFALRARLGGGRLAMADPRAVPAGRYGKAALIQLGVWQTVQDRVVAADSARSALAFVERGEARAGIVYETDARASAKVMVAGVFPPNSHLMISYPMAQVSGGQVSAAAFQAFLMSSAGKAIFARYGFLTP